MRKWLFKISAALLFVLFLLCGVEYYAISHDDSGFRTRVDWFKAHDDEVEGLIFGPSYLVKGINPAGLDRPTASLALKGSAPDVDAQLLHIALDRSSPEFILFDLTKGTLERRKSVGYYSKRKLLHYMGVWHEGWELKDLFMTDYPLYRYFYREPDPEQVNERGWPTVVEPGRDRFAAVNYNKDSVTTMVRESNYHTRRTQLFDAAYAQNLTDLRRVVERCRENGITLIFVDPPKYQIFNSRPFPEHAARRRAFLDEVVDGETVLFWDDATFGDDDPRNFHNNSHMSPLGGQRWTAELNRRLNQL